MADKKVEVDADGWGERDDWAVPDAQPRPKRSLWFAAGGGVLFVALMATLVLRRADTAREQAEAEQHAALDARVQMANAKVRAARPKTNPAPDPGPRLDPAEALRLMAGDAEALNKLGMYRLTDTDDIEGAIAALQDAANLDPKYAPNLDRAIRRKAELALKEQVELALKKQKEQVERDRVSAAAAVGGGPAVAVPPQPEM